MKRLIETIKLLSIKLILVLICALFTAMPLSYGQGANCPEGESSQTCTCCSASFCAASSGRCATCASISISVSGPSDVAAGSTVTYNCTGGSGGTYSWSTGSFSGGSGSSTIVLTVPVGGSGAEAISCTLTQGSCTWDDATAATVYSLDSFSIVNPTGGSLWVPTPVLATANASSANVAIFPAQISWSCYGRISGGESGENLFNSTFTAERSHNCELVIIAAACRYSDFVSDSVSLTTFNAELKVQYDDLKSRKVILQEEIGNLGAEIIILEIDLAPKEILKQEAITAQQTALQAVQAWQSSIDSVTTTISVISSGFTVVAIVATGPANGWTLISNVVGPRALAESIAQELAEDLVAQVAVELSQAQQDLMAANVTYNAIVAQINLLDFQIEQKKEEKVAKELQLEDVINELAGLPVCP